MVNAKKNNKKKNNRQGNIQRRDNQVSSSSEGYVAVAGPSGQPSANLSKTIEVKVELVKQTTVTLIENAEEPPAKCSEKTWLMWKRWMLATLHHLDMADLLENETGVNRHADPRCSTEETYHSISCGLAIYMNMNIEPAMVTEFRSLNQRTGSNAAILWKALLTKFESKKPSTQQELILELLNLKLLENPNGRESLSEFCTRVETIYNKFHCAGLAVDKYLFISTVWRALMGVSPNLVSICRRQIEKAEFDDEVPDVLDFLAAVVKVVNGQ